MKIIIYRGVFESSFFNDRRYFMLVVDGKVEMEFVDPILGECVTIDAQFRQLECTARILESVSRCPKGEVSIEEVNCPYDEIPEEFK